MRANGTKTSVGALHDFTVTVRVRARRLRWREADRGGGLRAAWSTRRWRWRRGRLVALRFLRAGAERGRAPEKRKVTLRFRAVVDQDD